MNTIRRSTYSEYPGLLPIEPSDDFFRLIDLKPEDVFRPIDLTPEDVPFPKGQPSVRQRPRAPTRILIAFCTGVAVTLLWQSYGDAAREMISNSYRQLGWFAPRPSLAQNPRPPNAVAVAAPAALPAEKLNAMQSDLDAVGPDADTRSTDQTAAAIATGQEQMTRNTDQTATSVDQVPAVKASGVMVESRDDAASSQPTVRLNVKPTEVRPPQTLSDKGKPPSVASGNDASCFPSSSAVLQNHPGGWPTWTLRAPGHEGTMCWYAAARPRGSTHRNERVARKDIVGTAEHELFAPVAPHGRGGSWEGGLP
jgi:hypothetical protein